MKNINKLFALLAVVAFTVACVEDDDFTVPETSQAVLDAPDNIVSIQSIVNQYNNTFAGRDAEPITFADNAGFIEGYVISSDEGGNFFKELIIQDQAENPTVGLNVKVDVTPLFTRFDFGRRVYIKLAGLTLGETNGVLALGIGNDINRIPASLVDEHVLRDEETVTIVPKEISLGQIDGTQLNQWVKVNNVQFLESELGKTFASERGDTFDGDRLLQTCNDFFVDPVIFQTSTFSDFKALRIPGGSGSVNAIVSKDFTGEDFVLNSNSPENFNFDLAVRCEFDVVNCGLTNGRGPNTLINEGFSAGSNNQVTVPAGWTNYIEAGTARWTTYFDGDISSAATRIGTRGSRDVSSIAWLITPRLNFDAQTGEVFSFISSNDFSDGSSLEILFSNDWNGTPAGVTSATWQPVADAKVVPDTEFFRNFVPSGNVSLDCVTGTGAIAFRYIGNDSPTDDFNGGYQIDDVLITSN